MLLLVRLPFQFWHIVIKPSYINRNKMFHDLYIFPIICNLLFNDRSGKYDNSDFEGKKLKKKN